MALTHHQFFSCFDCENFAKLMCMLDKKKSIYKVYPLAKDLSQWRGNSSALLRKMWLNMLLSISNIISFDTDIHIFKLKTDSDVDPQNTISLF